MEIFHFIYTTKEVPRKLSQGSVFKAIVEENIAKEYQSK